MLPSPVELNLPPGERWTTHLDKKIIDHVIASPEVELIEKPWVYVFDKDDTWLQAAGVSQNWLEEEGYIFIPGHGASTEVKNLHRVTDHRPVRVSIALP
jgi:hypothetical protein